MNLLGDRGLGDVKLLRRPRKAQILRHRHKTLHLKYGHFYLHAEASQIRIEK